MRPRATQWGLLALVALASCSNPLTEAVEQQQAVTLSPHLVLTDGTGRTIEDGGGVDFGEVGVAAPESLGLLVKNRGQHDLVLSRAELAGIEAEHFHLDPALPLTIGPGAEVTLTVSLNPDVLGTKTATLTLTTNDVERASVVLHLSGLGIQQVAAPVFAGGLNQTFPAGFTTVTISCATPGATIYYTTDGSLPDKSKVGVTTSIYTAPFAITYLNGTNTGVQNVRAIASVDNANGYKDSPVQTARFSQEVVAIPTADLAAKTFYPGEAIPAITLVSSSTNVSIIYTVDGTTPSGINGFPLANGGSFVYSGPHTGGSFTLRAIAFVSEFVVSDPSVPVVYSFKLAAPTFSPVQRAAAYSSPLAVSLTTPTSTGTIAHSLDGGSSWVPGATTSLTATGVVTPLTQAIQARATLTDWLDSDVTAITYTVNPVGVWDTSEWDKANWQ